MRTDFVRQFDGKRRVIFRVGGIFMVGVHVADFILRLRPDFSRRGQNIGELPRKILNIAASRSENRPFPTGKIADGRTGKFGVFCMRFFHEKSNKAMTFDFLMTVVIKYNIMYTYFCTLFGLLQICFFPSNQNPRNKIFV